MKLAIPKLSKDAILALLLEHCEKIGAGIVLLIAVWLTWSGIAAVRTRSASGDLLPGAISAQAAAALQHVEKAEQPPDEMLLESRGLAETIATWAAPAEREARRPVLARPLFPELAKRSQPEVFAVEDLRAVAGIAVLARAAEEPTQAGVPPRGAAGRPPAGPFGPIPGGGPGGPGVENQTDPALNVRPARILPYVIVTGLIPHRKQSDEYARRFEEASFRDPQRDLPLWADFLVERNDVTNGPGDAWERLNLKAIVAAAQKDWAGVQADGLPAEYFLAPAEQPAIGELSYAWPLPQLAMESWGPEAVHPWALADWRRRVAEQEALSRRDRRGPIGPTAPTAPPQTPFGAGSMLPPGFGGPAGFDPAAPPMFEPPPGIVASEANRVDFKIFRFVDTAVKTGHVYRYRVRVSLWNPNYRVPAQHLTEADLAKATKLPSGASNETPPVTTPGETGVLARLLPAEPKKGTAEVLVLWPNDETGNYALHSVTTVPGSVVSVPRKIEEDAAADERKPARPGKGKNEPRTEAIPVGLLVDFVGQQSAPSGGGQRPAAGRRGRKATPPAEPFELILLDGTGNLEHASVIDSETRYRLYEPTLPMALRWQPAAGPGLEPGMAIPSAPLFPGFR